MNHERTLMRTVTLRVPDDWRGLVDSWAVQVMLRDFSRNRVLSELVVDPQPGRARLSLSLPEIRTYGIPESVFLRRLIASYLPALNSFRSSQRTVRLPRLHGQTYEAGAGVTVQKALPANRETRMETSKRELDYIRLGAYGGQQISERLKKTGSSDAGRSLPGLSEASIKVLFALSVVAILAAVFFFRRNGVTAVKAAGGVPMLGYQPWNPKVL